MSKDRADTRPAGMGPTNHAQPRARPSLLPAYPVWGDWITWLAVIGLLTLAALFARGPVPLDETRYLGVAWEMWQRGDFLVPFKNGQPYSHKPPLLFWLIHAGWAVFGVNDWWPRLLAPGLALINTWFTWHLARRFWPGMPQVARLAPLILLSTLVWLVYAQALMFDMLITSCALMGLLALVRASQAGGGSGHWWGVYGLAVGLGVLAKGPAILVHLLPAALLAPWWGGIRNPGRWYGGVLLGLLLGVALALAWAIPAGMHGGAAYQQAIFWGQTADRMVSSFAHERPFWWYLAALPLFFFPWLAWPGLLTRLRTSLRGHGGDGGLRFILVWLGAALLVFSAISGKQPHYILPEAPALALLMAFVLARGKVVGRPLIPALGLMALGVALTWLALQPGKSDWTASLPSWCGTGFILGGLALCYPLPRPSTLARVRWITAVMLACILWLLLVFLPPQAPGFDMAPMGRQLARLQAQGYAIAHAGKYHGQYHFAGRLRQPLEELDSSSEIQAWLATHPRGALVLYFSRKEAVAALGPLHVQPYRGRQAALFTADRAVAALAKQQRMDDEEMP